MRTKKGNEISKSDIILNGQTFEEVDNFKYLEASITSQNEVEADIKGKIAAGNRCYRSFSKILGTRYISKNTKIRIYKTIIRPVVLHGSETWAITGKMASSLMTCERNILRKVYGPKCEQGVWRIRTNLELQNVYRSPHIVTEIKVRRLEWLGHIIRMDGFRIAKKVFVSKPESRRDIRRPKLRWLDDAEDDIKALGVRR
jgi:hypothetical protein